MPTNTQLSVSSLNGDLRVLRKALRFADRCGLIRYRGVSTLPGERNRIFVVSGELEKAYLAAAEYPLKQVAILMLDLGLRPEECVALRKVDIITAFITVVSGKTANARRTLPQTERTREVFDLCFALHPNSEWVFPGRKPGTHLTRNRVSMAHCELRGRCMTPARAIVPVNAIETHNQASLTNKFPREFLLYSLRHTCATRWAESGMDIFTLSKMLGHSSVKVTEKYVHVMPDHVALAMRRAEEYGRYLRGELHEDSPSLK